MNFDKKEDVNEEEGRLKSVSKADCDSHGLSNLLLVLTGQHPTPLPRPT